ncbi:MAG: hypothetical protein HFH39_13220 [Lachnospiraceae bacterium]|nr:hypothetical protein [Lachnospiraceae bacterium]
MEYPLEVIKDDLSKMKPYEFYQKYIMRSYNWYFEHVLLGKDHNILEIADDFKFIISKGLGISFHNIAMVGSGKLGYSLSPAPDKCLKRFNNDEKIRNISEIDVAVISDKLFHTYWDILRNSYRTAYSAYYDYIPGEIYRGYINEKNLLEIGGCRKKWKQNAMKVKKELFNELYIKHEVTFRLYRSWEDFEQYNIQSIRKIKRRIADGATI